MKFGLELEGALFPLWRSYYVDYEGLKDLLDELRDNFPYMQLFKQHNVHIEFDPSEPFKFLMASVKFQYKDYDDGGVGTHSSTTHTGVFRIVSVREREEDFQARMEREAMARALAEFTEQFTKVVELSEQQQQQLLFVTQKQPEKEKRMSSPAFIETDAFPADTHTDGSDDEDTKENKVQREQVADLFKKAASPAPAQKENEIKKQTAAASEQSPSPVVLRRKRSLSRGRNKSPLSLVPTDGGYDEDDAETEEEEDEAFALNNSSTFVFNICNDLNGVGGGGFNTKRNANSFAAGPARSSGDGSAASAFSSASANALLKRRDDVLQDKLAKFRRAVLRVGDLNSTTTTAINTSSFAGFGGGGDVDGNNITFRNTSFAAAGATFHDLLKDESFLAAAAAMAAAATTNDSGGEGGRGRGDGGDSRSKLTIAAATATTIEPPPSSPPLRLQRITSNQSFAAAAPPTGCASPRIGGGGIAVTNAAETANRNNRPIIDFEAIVAAVRTADLLEASFRGGTAPLKATDAKSENNAALSSAAAAPPAMLLPIQPPPLAMVGSDHLASDSNGYTSGVPECDIPPPRGFIELFHIDPTNATLLKESPMTIASEKKNDEDGDGADETDNRTKADKKQKKKNKKKDSGGEGLNLPPTVTFDSFGHRIFDKINGHHSQSKTAGEGATKSKSENAKTGRHESGRRANADPAAVVPNKNATPTTGGTSIGAAVVPSISSAQGGLLATTTPLVPPTNVELLAASFRFTREQLGQMFAFDGAASPHSHSSQPVATTTARNPVSSPQAQQRQQVAVGSNSPPSSPLLVPNTSFSPSTNFARRLSAVREAQLYFVKHVVSKVLDLNTVGYADPHLAFRLFRQPKGKAHAQDEKEDEAEAEQAHKKKRGAAHKKHDAKNNYQHQHHHRHSAEDSVAYQKMEKLRGMAIEHRGDVGESHSDSKPLHGTSNATLAGKSASASHGQLNDTPTFLMNSPDYVEEEVNKKNGDSVLPPAISISAASTAVVASSSTRSHEPFGTQTDKLSSVKTDDHPSTPPPPTPRRRRSSVMSLFPYVDSNQGEGGGGGGFLSVFAAASDKQRRPASYSDNTTATAALIHHGGSEGGGGGGFHKRHMTYGGERMMSEGASRSTQEPFASIVDEVIKSSSRNKSSSKNATAFDETAAALPSTNEVVAVSGDDKKEGEGGSGGGHVILASKDQRMKKLQRIQQLQDLYSIRLTMHMFVRDKHASEEASKHPHLHRFVGAALHPSQIPSKVKGFGVAIGGLFRDNNNSNSNADGSPLSDPSSSAAARLGTAGADVENKGEELALEADESSPAFSIRYNNPAIAHALYAYQRSVSATLAAAVQIEVEKVSNFYVSQTHILCRAALLSIDSVKQWTRLSAREKEQLRTVYRQTYLTFRILQQYCDLNIIALGKFLKKVDKNLLQNSLENYRLAVEDLNFRMGHDSRIIAVQKLMVHKLAHHAMGGSLKKAFNFLETTREENSDFTSGGGMGGGMRLGKSKEATLLSLAFFAGLCLTMGTMIVLLLIASGAKRDVLLWSDSFSSANAEYLMLVPAIFAVPQFLFSINVLIYERFGVNFAFMFELDPIFHFTGAELMRDSLIYIFAWMVCVYAFLRNSYNAINCASGRDALVNDDLQSDVPSVAPLWAIFPIYLAIWLSIAAYNRFISLERRPFWSAEVFWRILTTPYFTVRFPDFFVCNYLTSMTTVLFEIQWYWCTFTTDPLSQCTAGRSMSLCFINSLPNIWRMVQSIRRYLDQPKATRKAFPNLVNGGKYFTGVIQPFVWTAWAIARYHEADEHVLRLMYGLAFISQLVTQSYKYCWDVVVDAGIFIDYGNGYEWRRERVYKAWWPYILFMMVDFVLRWRWLVTYYVQLHYRPAWFFAMWSMVELIRRSFWSTFRVENEHVNNTEHYRATKLAPIPVKNIHAWDTFAADSSPEQFLSKGKRDQFSKEFPQIKGVNLSSVTRFFAMLPEEEKLKILLASPLCSGYVPKEGDMDEKFNHSDEQKAKETSEAVDALEETLTVSRFGLNTKYMASSSEGGQPQGSKLNTPALGPTANSSSAPPPISKRLLRFKGKLGEGKSRFFSELPEEHKLIVIVKHIGDETMNDYEKRVSKEAKAKEARARAKAAAGGNVTVEEDDWSVKAEKQR